MKKVAALFMAVCWMLGAGVQAAQFNVLVFTKTLGWEHKSQHEGVAAFRDLAAQHDFGLEWRQDTQLFTDAGLKPFDVIVFLSTTGDVLNDAEQGTMERFIRSGKGFVGIHAAADTEYDWPWYRKLVGRHFVSHPATQSAKVDVLSRAFPGTEHMPDRYLWTDEYYDYGPEAVDGLTYVLSVDESTYNVLDYWGGPPRGKGMGEFHPMAWYHDFDGGRSFYTGLGHLGGAYANPMFKAHLYGGIYWAATGKGIEK